LLAVMASAAGVVDGPQPNEGVGIVDAQAERPRPGATPPPRQVTVVEVTPPFVVPRMGPADTVLGGQRAESVVPVVAVAPPAPQLPWAAAAVTLVTPRETVMSTGRERRRITERPAADVDATAAVAAVDVSSPFVMRVGGDGAAGRLLAAARGDHQLPEVPVWKCPVCPWMSRAGARVSALAAHLDAVHAADAPLLTLCAHCAVRERSVRAMFVHIAYQHADRPAMLRCALCETGYPGPFRDCPWCEAAADSDGSTRDPPSGGSS